MPIWARLKNGACVEFTRADPEGRYHPSLTWVQVPAALEPWADHTYLQATDGVGPVSLLAFVEQMKSGVAAKRYDAETGSTVSVALASGTTAAFETDRTIEARLTSARMLAADVEKIHGPGSWSTLWKTPRDHAHDNVTVTLTDIIAIGLALGAHVQAAFAREAAIVAALNAAAAAPDATWQTMLATYETEISAGWPGQ